MHVHTRLFFLLFVSFLLQAGIFPVTLVMNMNNIPNEHVAPCNGNEGYSLPTRARVTTGDTYPLVGDAIAFEDPTHSRSDRAKARIAIHIKNLVRRGGPHPLGLRPRRM